MIEALYEKWSWKFHNVRALSQVIQGIKQMDMRETLTHAQFHLFAWMLDEVFQGQADSEWSKRGGAEKYFR